MVNGFDNVYIERLVRWKNRVTFENGTTDAYHRPIVAPLGRQWMVIPMVDARP
jgi:hypothetical protein